MKKKNYTKHEEEEEELFIAREPVVGYQRITPPIPFTQKDNDMTALTPPYCVSEEVYAEALRGIEMYGDEETPVSYSVEEMRRKFDRAVLQAEGGQLFTSQEVRNRYN